MIKNSVTLDETIQFLNELIEIDSDAIAELATYHAGCNELLAYHPTVQVGGELNEYEVGIVGILNGLFGIDDKTKWGPISFIFADGNLIKVVRTDFDNIDTE